MNDQIRIFTGRKQIFSDETEVTIDNVRQILNETLPYHLQNAVDIKYLIEYAKGDQPIWYREKPVRPEINIKTVFNRAAQIVDFKLKYEFGSPITFVQRSKDSGSPLDINDNGVAKLNEMFNYSGKPSIDLKIAKNFKTCGVGYRLIEPWDNPLSLFKMASLNPMTCYVAYKNDAYREPLLGVSFIQNKKGEVKYTCYSEDTIYVIKSFLGGGFSGDIKVYPNLMRKIPIIEYVNDYDRMSAFEKVIPDIDALNITNSDRINDIAQHVQGLLWANNCEFDSKQNISSHQIISTKSPPGIQGTIKFLDELLNQSEVQTLVDHINDQIDIIANIPGRQETGGGSTGSAMNLSNGWQAAEVDAKGSEIIFSEGERRTLDVVDGIIRNSANVPDELLSLRMSDIEPKFARNKTYDLATKCSSLATLINIGVDGLTAFTQVSLFPDPQLAWVNSSETVERIRSANGKVTPDDIKNIVRNNTIDQPSKVANVDEGA